ncbi:MAG: AAA family ATPase [Prevotella sp.]|nr:AAA family ATPase [Prevotella sp.]
MNISIAFPMGIDPSLTYFNSNITIKLELGRKLSIRDSYNFFIYNRSGMLCGMKFADDERADAKSRTLEVDISCPELWMPGEYMLLVRSSSDKIVRWDMTLDEQHHWTVSEPVMCHELSDEDILSSFSEERRYSWRSLFQRPGAAQLRRFAIERLRQMRLDEVRSAILDEKLEFNNNIIIATQGQQADAFGCMCLRQVTGLNDKTMHVDCGKLFDALSNDPYEKLRDLTNDAKSDDGPFSSITSTTKPTIYVLRDIAALLDSHGKTVMRELLRIMPGACSSMILNGRQQDIDQLLEQYPSLQKHFPASNRLTIEPFSKEEMLFYLVDKIQGIDKMLLSDEALDALARTIVNAYDAGTICHWDIHDMNYFSEELLKPRYLSRMARQIAGGVHPLNAYEVQPGDIPSEALQPQSSLYDDALKELNEMIGLENIKTSITTQSNRMRFFAERRRLGLKTKEQSICHAIFTGNPGTGKTTVAKLLGKIYHSLGLLSKGEVITIDRTKVIGRYIGETEENMKAVLEEARGNVLFVDEAYTFYSGTGDNDFGRHVIEALLPVLAQPNPDMLIIFAGYEREMDQLMSMNPGLVGRFPYKFRFDDYTADELMRIGMRLLEHDEYVLTEEARNEFRSTIESTLARKSKHFANARWIEHYVEGGIIPATADRIMTTPSSRSLESFRQITVADVDTAYRQFNPQKTELKPRQRVGFSV